MKNSPLLKHLSSGAVFDYLDSHLSHGFFRRISILLIFLAAIGLKNPLEAQTTRTWNGGGGDTNWNTVANWGGTAPIAGNIITFAGTVQSITNNNLGADTSFAGINFTNTVAGQAFTLEGDRITLGGNITTSTLTGGVSSATILDTINLDLILSGTRTITTAASATHGTHNLTITGLISETSAGVGGLTKNGGSGGVLTLSNNSNSFTGPLTLVSGTILFATIGDTGVASALGAGGTIITGSSVGSTGTLNYTGSGHSTNRQIQIGAGPTLNDTTGVIISNTGTGALVFSNANFNVLAPTYTATKTLTLNSDSGNGNNTISGIIANNNNTNGFIAVTKNGGSTSVWVLSGLNTYSGQTRIDVGILSANTLADSGTASSLGTGSSNSVITIGSSTSNGTLLYTGGVTSTNRQIQIGRSTVNAGSATIQNDGTGALTFTNANFNASDTTMTTSVARTLTLRGTNTGNNTINGVISNNVAPGPIIGTVSVVKTDAGIWVLAGANTFTGQVRVDNGILSVNSLANAGVSSAIGAAPAGATSVIRLGAQAVSTGTLLYTGGTTSTDRQIQVGSGTNSSFGAIVQNDGTGPLTFTNANFNAADTAVTTATTRPLTFQGTNGGEVQGVISNSVATATATTSVSKAGGGTWTFSGANTYSGGTSLSAGTLNLNNAGSGGTSSSLGTGTLTITGGTIDNTTAAPLTLSTNNPVAFNGDFGFGGTQDLNLGNGVVTIGGASRTITLNNNKTLTMGQLQWNSTLDRTLTVTQGTGSGGKLVIGGFQLAPTATSAITRTIVGNGGVEITGPVVNGGSFPINLAYRGAGVLTLSAPNSYTGITTSGGGGLLVLNNATALPGGATGSLAGTSYLNFNDGGIIGLTSASGDFTRAIDTTTSPATVFTGNLVRWGVSGGESGGFAAFGGNRVVNFGGAGTPTTVSWSNGNGVLGAGLILGHSTADSTVTVLNPISLSNAAGSRTVTVNDGGAAVDGVMAGVISSLTTANNGTRFVKNGLGTLALTAENTYVSGSFTGSTANNPLAFGTTISAGTLQLGNGGTTGSISALTGSAINSDVSIASGAFFAFNRSNGLTVANVITGAGAVTQRGTGTTTLTAANTYSGTTSVTNGTLLINNTTGSGTGTGAVTTSSSTVLGGTGTLSPGSGNSISIAGSLAPGTPTTNSGVGTLTFTPVSGDATFASTSTLDFQLLTQGLHGYSATYNLDGTLSTLTGSYVGGGNDRLIFNGGAAANKLDFSNLGTSNFNVTFGSGYTPAANDLFDLLDWTNLTGIGNGNLNNEASAIAGLTLAQLDLPTLSGGLLWDTSFWTSHGVIGIVVVPEPSRVLMLALGLSALIMRRRRW